MSPQGVYPAADVGAIGDEISSTYEGRHITLYADNLSHSNALAVVTKGYPVWWSNGVGVAFETQVAGQNPLIAVDTEGIWIQDVHAQDDAGGSAVIPGDALYINTTTGLISKIVTAVTQIPFGYAFGNVGSGLTETIAVKVHWDPVCHFLLDKAPLFFGDDKDVNIAWNGERLVAAVSTATPAMADGYGLFDFITAITGVATGHMAAMSTWVNLDAGADLSGTGGGIVTPHTDGIYGAAGATITGAFVVFGAVYQEQLNAADFGWLGLFRLNMLHTMTAIFEVNNPALFGYVAGAHASAVVGSVPFFSTGGGAVKWIRLYGDAT